jgi:hypothetical protein
MGNCSRRQGVQQQSPGPTCQPTSTTTTTTTTSVQRKWRWAIKRVIVMLRMREAWNKEGTSLKAAKAQGDDSDLAKVRRKAWAELGHKRRKVWKNLFGHVVRKSGILQLRA